MFFRNIRVNTNSYNVLSAVMFLLAVAGSFAVSIGVIGFFLVPYMFNHIKVIWR